MTSEYEYSVRNFLDTHSSKYYNYPNWFVSRAHYDPHSGNLKHEYLGKDLVWRGKTNFKQPDLTAYCETKEEAEQRLKDWKEQNDV